MRSKHPRSRGSGQWILSRGDLDTAIARRNDERAERMEERKRSAPAEPATGTAVDMARCRSTIVGRREAPSMYMVPGLKLIPQQ
jgi:hypothetical protein